MNNPSEITLAAIPADIKAPKVWETARHHAENVGSGIKAAVVASVLLGVELNRIQLELGYSRTGGRPRKDDERPAWGLLVAAMTGFSHRSCSNFQATAKRIRQRLQSAKDKAAKTALTVLDSPRADWDLDDYEILADTLGRTFNAETMNSLMMDLGLLKTGGNPDNLLPGSSAGAGRVPGSQTLAQLRAQAQLQFRGLYRSMCSLRASGKKYREWIASLPLESEDPEQVSLYDVRDELRTTLGDIEAAADAATAEAATAEAATAEAATAEASTTETAAT